MAAAEKAASLSLLVALDLLSRTARSSTSLGRCPVRSSSLSRRQFSSLLCFALVNQFSTILLTHRCSITSTLSLSNRLVGLRLSMFWLTSSVSRPISNGFTWAGIDPRKRDQSFWAELNQYPAYTYLRFK